MLQQYFRSKGVTHIPNYSAEDPEATGMVEAFMKHCKKIFHSSDFTHTVPYLKLNDYLLLHRAMAHPTTKKCPAEQLFNRNLYTTLPDNDRQEKEKMKQELDSKANAQDHPIKRREKVVRTREKQDMLQNRKGQESIKTGRTSGRHSGGTRTSL